MKGGYKFYFKDKRIKGLSSLEINVDSKLKAKRKGIAFLKAISSKTFYKNNIKFIKVKKIKRFTKPEYIRL